MEQSEKDLEVEKIFEHLFSNIKNDYVLYAKDNYKHKTLDLYVEINLNPNYLGMIDQVVCTRGNIFVGTWFSTFSGYITRMRGYMGKEDKTIYYGDMKHRDRFQKPELPMYPFYMREWNISWYNID